mgnify:CR=1 FL=1
MSKRRIEISMNEGMAGASFILTEEEAAELQALLEFARYHRPLDPRTVRVHGAMVSLTRRD